MFCVRIYMTNYHRRVSFTRRLEFESEAACTDEAFHEGLWGLLMQVCAAVRGEEYMRSLCELSCGEVMTLTEIWGFHYSEIDLGELREDVST
jgi:hypothetical protein